jgi:mannose-6-phosphate isomerase-like protein (cupin superfamily)
MGLPLEEPIRLERPRNKAVLPLVAGISLAIGYFANTVRNEITETVLEKNPPAVAPVNPENQSSSPTSMDPIISQLDPSVKRYDIDGGVCYLYPDAENAELSSAYVIQDGRYPVENFKMNRECTEAFFIIDGEYTLTLGHNTTVLKPHDIVYVPLNTPYSIEGKGTSFVFITPKWKGEQNVHCDQDGNELPKPEKK